MKQAKAFPHSCTHPSECPRPAKVLLSTPPSRRNQDSDLPHALLLNDAHQRVLCRNTNPSFSGVTAPADQNRVAAGNTLCGLQHPTHTCPRLDITQARPDAKPVAAATNSFHQTAALPICKTLQARGTHTETRAHISICARTGKTISRPPAELVQWGQNTPFPLRHLSLSVACLQPAAASVASCCCCYPCWTQAAV